MKPVFIFTFIILGAILSGCVESPQGKVIEFSTIDKGAHSGYKDRNNFIITTGRTWEELWDTHNLNTIPKPELPVVDFKKDMVIAVFMGERSTGGYSVEVTKIVKMEDKLAVTINEQSPPPGSIVTQALTQPYHIIKLEKTDLPVNFMYSFS